MPKILVVDDEKAIVYLIKTLLEREQFTVLEAHNGLEAYKALTGAAPGDLPDLVISDAMMPEMDGYTLQSKVQEIDRLSKIPFIILTGKDDQAKDLFALSANVFAFLQKPFERAELVKLAKAALAARNRAPRKVKERAPAAAAAGKVLKGAPASKGIGIGRLFLLNDYAAQPGVKGAPGKPEEELRRYRAAREQVRVRFTLAATHILKELGPGNGNILDVHPLILKDPVLNQEIELRIQAGEKAEVAVETVFKAISDRQKQAKNEYLRERFTVSRDIGRQLVIELLGAHRLEAVRGKGDVIVAAKELTPFALAEHPENIKGFAVETGGLTGHAAILARAYNIPMVLGIPVAGFAAQENVPAIINGGTGELILNPSPAVLENNLRCRDREAAAAAKASAETAAAQTTDGRRVNLLMNLETTQSLANTYGADGVGLFRSEFLFMHKAALPGEEEQFREFEKAARAMHPRKVVIRTVDFGGDKQPPAAADPAGASALRGIRYCLAHEELFRAHLRAILRAGAAGNVEVMFPMVPGLETFRKAKAFLKKTAEELKAEGFKLDKALRVGIMIEVPSAAMSAGVLAREADFFSIGTNDLFQYTLGIDREDSSYSGYGLFLPPSLLQLISMVTEAARSRKKPVAVCGELAHNTLAMPLLLGLGVDELSMDASHIPSTRLAVRGLSYAKCRALADKALKLETPAEIKELLTRAG
ncbi:MAG TPA: phosphoenolpyruvate--protein phosphotransferase [Elusimicrobiales bacterium]|nr:phosphoenolpyruvate--protein phosphotransferase [Elusimicrobiales bacterium]